MLFPILDGDDSLVSCRNIGESVSLGGTSLNELKGVIWKFQMI